MLPVIDTSGQRTFFQIILGALLLLPISLLPTVIGLSHTLYLFGAMTLGIMMIVYSLISARSRLNTDARRLFRFSLLYLPALFTIIVIDAWL